MYVYSHLDINFISMVYMGSVSPFLHSDRNFIDVENKKLDCLNHSIVLLIYNRLVKSKI